jgi:hypothetical protein
MHILAVDAATIGAWAAIATVVIYIILATYAAIQVSEARKLREEQTRPFVIAELVPDFLIAFRIKNIGATLAKDVTIEWDTWPVVTMDDPTWRSKDSTILFGKGIPSLGPGQDVSTTFDHFPNRVEKKLPMQYRVTVHYSSFDGRRSYSELFMLDLDLYANLRNVRKKTTHDLAEELKKIRGLMDKWTDIGSRGLKVGAYDRDRFQARESRPIYVSHLQEHYRQDGVRGAARYAINEIRRTFGLHGFR